MVRVTDTEYELSNGDVIPHVVPLDHTPTAEEFQETLKQTEEMFRQAGLLDEATRLNR